MEHLIAAKERIIVEDPALGWVVGGTGTDVRDVELPEEPVPLLALETVMASSYCGRYSPLSNGKSGQKQVHTTVLQSPPSSVVLGGRRRASGSAKAGWQLATSYIGCNPTLDEGKKDLAPFYSWLQV